MKDEPRVKLWTYHPSTFRIDDPQLSVDYMRGKYWQDDSHGFRYREVLPILCELLGTTNFVWCCTARGKMQKMTSDEDLVEWEISLPMSNVLKFYSELVWDKIIWGKSDDWQPLFVSDIKPSGDLGALVKVPLLPEVAFCHGQVKPKY